MSRVREKLKARKALVPVNANSEAAQDALEVALSQLDREGSLIILHVIEMKRALRLDAYDVEEMERARSTLKELSQLASQRGVKVEGSIFQAREAGHAILREAVGRGVDLVVVGLDNAFRHGEFGLGETVPYVLKHAPCRVILLREPRSSVSPSDEPDSSASPPTEKP